MPCLVPPARRVWRRLSARLCLRRTTGLGRLRKEVRTCEYSDVHVMWEMLSKPSSGGGGGGAGARRRHTSGKGTSAATRRARAGRKATAWSRLASYCCAL